MRKSYAGAPQDMRERVDEAATKALEVEIREAISISTSGRQGRFTATLMLLRSFIGEED